MITSLPISNSHRESFIYGKSCVILSNFSFIKNFSAAMISKKNKEKPNITREGEKTKTKLYENVHVPKNSPPLVSICFLNFLCQTRKSYIIFHSITRLQNDLQTKGNKNNGEKKCNIQGFGS